MLDLGACCLMSEAFLYLRGMIHLIDRCLIGEVLRYIEVGPLDWSVTSRRGATPMQAKLIKLDLGYARVRFS